MALWQGKAVIKGRFPPSERIKGMQSSRGEKQGYLLEKPLVMVADQCKEAYESFALRCMSSDIASTLLANNCPEVKVLSRGQHILGAQNRQHDYRYQKQHAAKPRHYEQNIFSLIWSIKSHIVHCCSQNSAGCSLQELCAKLMGSLLQVSSWRRGLLQNAVP